MESVTRAILDEAKLMAKQFRGLCITGPRQSGKTTFSQMVFGSKPYVTFENPKVQTLAEQDPEAFLKQYAKGAIFDEVQRVPDIFRYLQELLDKDKTRGQFILTGSNNFLLQEQIAQSLAGRVGYLKLLPFSLAELQAAGLATHSLYSHIIKGGYPEIWDQQLIPGKWMGSYVQTYVQRDVRLIRNITNLGQFTRFLQLLANYAGQLINREEIGRTIGVDNKTVQSWLGILEESYIVYLLQPWYNNLNKRITKTPKLYFYDTGLLCYLMGITTEAKLRQHNALGAIFENWVITEIRKNQYNAGLDGGMYFFRDSAGNEVDLVLEKNGSTYAIEIKATVKPEASHFAGLKYWQKHARLHDGFVIAAGKGKMIPPEPFSLLSWDDVVDV
ncbi:ATP-binding protein [Phnomibacter sp. MR]|uniref:ATP-binding protein n=1 Tax=Phnomibacter sp. MR TaxID=3042318 RepID=UPI003A806870